MRSGRFWPLPSKPVLKLMGPSAADGGHAQACSLGRHFGRADRDCGHLRHEL